jgi:ribosome-associated protein
MQDRDFSPEFEFITSRSSGAGGQNVNKVNTKAELRFDVNKSALLSDEEKALLYEKAANHITKEGILQVVCQESRSQLKNKERCIEKFYILLEECFTPEKERKESKPGKAAKIKRLKAKKIVSIKKSIRREKNFETE